MKKQINEVKRMQQLAGIFKEDTAKFYAPNYVKEKYGDATASEIERNIEDAEETEGNPNLYDLYLSLETPEETEEFIKGFMSV